MNKPYVLPVPFMNICDPPLPQPRGSPLTGTGNGGSHAGGRLAFQEFVSIHPRGHSMKLETWESSRS